MKLSELPTLEQYVRSLPPEHPRYKYYRNWISADNVPKALAVIADDREALAAYYQDSTARLTQANDTQ